MPGEGAVPPQTPAGLSPQRKAFFGPRDIVIINPYNGTPIYGYAAEFRVAAEEFMAAKGYLLSNGVTQPYEGGNDRLQRNFRRLEVTFEDAADDAIHAKNARLEDSTLRITLAVNRRRIGEIIGNLHPGAFAFLVVHAYDRGRETSLPIFALAEPAGYTGEGKGLYKRLAEVGNKFLKDKNPVVDELKKALCQRRVPERFLRTLLSAGWPEKDIMAVARLVNDGRFRFNIEAMPKVERGVLEIDTVTMYPIQYIKVLAHPDDAASFTRADIYSAMARGIILLTSFSRSAQSWRFDRAGLAGPFRLVSKYYPLGRGPLVRNIYGDWKGDWLFRADRALRLITAFPAIDAAKGEGDDEERGEKETRALLRHLSTPALSTEDVPRWLGTAVKGLLDWGSVREFAVFARILLGIRDFALVTARQPNNRVTAELDTANRKMIIRVPEAGYQRVSEADIFHAVGRLMTGGKKEILSAPAAEEAYGILRLLLARLKRRGGTSSFNISIDGNAPEAVLNGLAAVISRLWDAGAAEASLEAEALRTWAGQRRDIIIEQIAAQDGQERTIAVPIEDGLLVLVEGRAPSEEQWQSLLAAAYLRGDRPVAVYHGQRGEAADISGCDPQRVKDFMDRAAGRTRSLSEGAEGNPVWAALQDNVKKERYVRALRWMRENRQRFITELTPTARDDGAQLKRKYDRFSRLYHPDRHPSDRGLFSEANQHWDALRDIFGGDAAMSVSPLAGEGPGSARFAHYLRMMADELSRASSLREVTRKLTELAREFELDPREVMDSVFNTGNRLHKLWNASVGEPEMETLRRRLKGFEKAGLFDDPARITDHVK
jgi:hypothetical protein